MRGNAVSAEWERRRAALDERRARVLADPVLGFYERHGRPGPGTHEEASDAPGGITDEEPGPA